MLFQIPVLTWSVVAIYSFVALLYVAGSRFVVRYYLLRRYLMPTVAEWRSTARAKPARICPIFC